MLAKVYTLDPHPDSPLDGLGTDPGSQLVLNQDNALGRFTCPNANPLHPPSIWAPFSLLPLLTLSSSPLQIMAHNRSLRRKGLSGSNVKAFMGAQAGQVFFIVGLSVAFGVGIGTKGIQDRLRAEIHREWMTALQHAHKTSVDH